MKGREKTKQRGRLAVPGALTVEALRPRHWADLERLFGANGACAGCWCMFWRLAKGERFQDIKGPTAKRRFKALVSSGAARGFLAFLDGEPVGWLAAGARRSFAKLDRAPSLAIEDADEVHSLPCFFVKAGFRGQGVASALLEAAVAALQKEGAHILEAYPVKPKGGERLPGAFAYTGTVALFTKAGFSLVNERPSGKQRMRLDLLAEEQLGQPAPEAAGLRPLPLRDRRGPDAAARYLKA